MNITELKKLHWLQIFKYNSKFTVSCMYNNTDYYLSVFSHIAIFRLFLFQLLQFFRWNIFLYHARCHRIFVTKYRFTFFSIISRFKLIVKHLPFLFAPVSAIMGLYKYKLNIIIWKNDELFNNKNKKIIHIHINKYIRTSIY